MEDKFFDTDSQGIEILVDGMCSEEAIVKAIPAIEIVHFDEQDRPATTETRLLSSFI